MKQPEPLFAVGSESPSKVKSVVDAVAVFWPKARVLGVRVNPAVSTQPMGETEAYAGALQRATNALEKLPGAEYGVGVEGGVVDAEDGMWVFASIVIVDRAGRIGKGKTGQFLLPQGVARLIREAGLELGEVDDHFFGGSRPERNEGAIGILSDGRVTRSGIYTHGVVFALLRFVHPDPNFTNKNTGRRRPSQCHFL